ncbi:DEAD/DEAH box helicase [Enterocloster hominis (ex Hitch et al. 2024)]|uniref:DEAD/DEAH box helicase family protein n=1 Tax=Enterocloster hominis (ex Hitch et al. 2024) TaxID=1917870 RepID=A0ABV1DF78_9FIRM
MIIKAGYEKPICERLRADDEQTDSLKIFHDYERERLKAFTMFSSRYITSILTPRIMRSWRPGGYIISAQTGAGKSTLILEQLLPLAMERKKYVAIIVPREALATQYKKEIAKQYCPEQLKIYTDKGISKVSKWGPVNIFTFQSLRSYSKQQDLLRNKNIYDAVVIDEVHAFVADAAFNSLTAEILEFLVVNFASDTKRIYLTATWDIALYEILMLERKLREVSPLQDSKTTIAYRFKSDYSYLALKFFQKQDTIIELLKRIPGDEKALIFVNSKKQGLEVKKSLGSQATFVDAESKRGEEADTYAELINGQTFSSKYLCATRWLDVGVNIKEEEVKHIVCFQFFKEEIIQMLGRRRVVSKQQRVNLYMLLPSENDLLKKSNDIESENRTMTEAVNRYCNHSSPGMIEELPFPIYVNEKEGRLGFAYNHYSFAINQYHFEQLEKFTNQKGDFKTHFCEEVLGWFPGCGTYKNLDGDLTDMRKKVDDILLPCLNSGKEFNKEEMMLLCENLITVMEIQRRADQKDNLPVGTLNKKFSEYGYPYKIQNLSGTGKRGCWIITN